MFRPQRVVIFVHEKLQELFRSAEVAKRVEELPDEPLDVSLPVNITTMTCHNVTERHKRPVRDSHTWRTGKPSDPRPRPSRAASVCLAAAHIQNSKPLDHQRTEELKIRRQTETAGERETNPTDPPIKPSNTHHTLHTSHHTLHRLLASVKHQQRD